jgi:hypothetical protein
MQQREGGRLEEERGAQAHQWRRNRVEVVAGLAGSGEQSCRPGGVSVQEKGEEKRGDARGFIAGISWRRGLGFGMEQCDGRLGTLPCLGRTPARG